MPHIRNLIISMALLGPLANSEAIAQSKTPTEAGMSIDALKVVYLDCERAAVSGKLATADIMLCSVIYEELKRRAFSGDFKRLKAWADTHVRRAEPELTGSN